MVRRRLLPLLLGFVALLVAAVGGPMPATAAAIPPMPAPSMPALPGAPPTPDDDGFYRPPSELDDFEPGELIRSRESRVYLDPARLTPAPVRAWQVLYGSTSARGEPNAVSGTVLVPPTPWTGDGPRPIVSYTIGTHGLGDQCAPSYQLASGTEQEFGLMSQALARGWAVVVTDYEGLGTPGNHTYVVQRSEGRAALDIVRAATQVPGAALSADAPVGIWGYSQGGGAAGSAAEQADGYAGELDVVGAAPGGVPADLLAVARNLDGSAAFGLLAAAAVGYDAGYPELEIFDELLNDRGRELFDDIRDECVVEFTASNAGGELEEFSTLDDPLAFPPLVERLEENRIGGVAPEMPVLLYHAQLDNLIPLSVARELFAEYCGRGVRTRFVVIPATEHIGGAIAGAPLAVSYLADRFAGRPAPSSC